MTFCGSACRRVRGTAGSSRIIVGGSCHVTAANNGMAADENITFPVGIGTVRFVPET